MEESFIRSSSIVATTMVDQDGGGGGGGAHDVPGSGSTAAPEADGVTKTTTTNNNTITTKTPGSAKASRSTLFFLIGSILYIPPSVFDIIWAIQDEKAKQEGIEVDTYYDYDGDDDGDSSDPFYYRALLVCGATCYLINGLLDMRASYKCGTGTCRHVACFSPTNPLCVCCAPLCCTPLPSCFDIINENIDAALCYYIDDDNENPFFIDEDDDISDTDSDISPSKEGKERGDEDDDDNTKSMILLNGGCFAVAAISELLSMYISPLQYASSLIFLLSAFVTIYLNRFYGRIPKSHTMIHFGDMLFLVGSLIDVFSVFLDNFHGDKVSDLNIACAWMASAIAWFVDAILYILADLQYNHKMPKFRNRSKSKGLVDTGCSTTCNSGGIQVTCTVGGATLPVLDTIPPVSSSSSSSPTSEPLLPPQTSSSSSSSSSASRRREKKNTTTKAMMGISKLLPTITIILIFGSTSYIPSVEAFQLLQLLSSPRIPSTTVTAETTTTHRHVGFGGRDRGTSSPSSTELNSSSGNTEDVYSAVHRKEYEMRTFKSQHTSTADPIIMAMSYGQESVSKMRLAKALRRVYDDPYNPANPENKIEEEEEDDDKADSNDKPKEKTRKEKLEELGMAEMTMRRASFIVDIKRKSLSRPESQSRPFCKFDDASLVAEAMARLGADAVMINIDYHSYGGDISELKSAVQAVRKVNDKTAVIMKDIVVDEIQLGIAKEAGADGILLIASVLGPALDNFLDLATTIGLETIVECHTKNEVQRALDALAPNILVSNYDRIQQRYYPQQAIQLAGMFPGSGGPIICLAGGDIQTTDDMKRHLAVGYDGVIIGKACMGSTKAPEFIRAVKDRTLLPAELSQWGLEHVEFDPEGNVMDGPKRDVPDPYDYDGNDNGDTFA